MAGKAGPSGQPRFLPLPKAMLVSATVLASPSQIFDDVREFTTASNPNAFATLDQAQQGLKLSLKGRSAPLPGRRDHLRAGQYHSAEARMGKRCSRSLIPSVLQQTLSTLLRVANIEPVQSDAGGITYYKRQNSFVHRRVSTLAIPTWTGI